MERSPIRTPEPPNARDLERIFGHIFDNAMGSPIILSGIPTSAQMKANTWGVYLTYLYIKLGNNVLLRFSGTEIS